MQRQFVLDVMENTLTSTSTTSMMTFATMTNLACPLDTAYGVDDNQYLIQDGMYYQQGATLFGQALSDYLDTRSRNPDSVVIIMDGVPTDNHCEQGERWQQEMEDVEVIIVGVGIALGDYVSCIQPDMSKILYVETFDQLNETVYEVVGMMCPDDETGIVT